MGQAHGYRRAWLRAGVALMAVVLLRPFPALAGEMTEARAAELHEMITPDTDAAWRTIPWETSVLAAQRAAVERGKPIFIWAMDGHPLGCV